MISHKFISTVVFLFFLELTQKAASQGNVIPGDEDKSSVQVTTSQCTDGKCQCVVETPPRYSYDAEYAKLLSISKRLDLMYVQVSGSYMEAMMLNITTLVSRVSTLETNIHNQSVSLSMKELAILQDQSNNLYQLVLQLAATNNASITQQLVSEIGNIRNSLLNINSRNPVAQNADLTSEVEKLKSRLASCATIANKHQEQDLDFIGDALYANQTINTDHCPSHYNISVGTPITYKYEYNRNGMWFKDPLPVGEEQKTRIYETYTGTNQYLYYWKTLDDYESTNFLTRSTKSTSCRYHTYDQKAIYLGGEWFWFDQYNSNNRLKKYTTVWNTACGGVTNPKPYPYINFNYIGHTYNDFDLNFDETGELYGIYADINGDMNIMTINRQTLAVKRNWNTGKKKAAVANVFMVCGRLYTIDDSGSTRHLTGMQWGYDTATSKEFFYSINVESAYGDIQALSYNPREKALFGWDNFHAVLYPVYF